MSGIIEVFDSKKGLKVKDTLKSLPRQDIIVLDSICNLFDLTGEEKVLAIDQVFHQVQQNCRKMSHPNIDQKQLVYCIEELEYYGFVNMLKQTKKQSKDVMTKKFKLTVDLKELCYELDQHPSI